MKIGTLLFILFLSLCLLGYVVEKKTGKVGVFLENQGISILKKEINNNDTELSSSKDGPAPVVIDLPQGFNKTSHRSIPSAFVLYEAELTYVTRTGLGEEEWFLISQYLSEEDYKKSLAESLSQNSYKGLRTVSAPASNLTIGGEIASEYVISLYDEDPTFDDELIMNYHFIAIPSKFVIIIFQHIPDIPDYEFTIPEIMEVISLIRFDNDPNHVLVSQKKSPEQIASEKVIINTQQALGMTFGLPADKRIEVSDDSAGARDGDIKTETAIILLTEDGGIVVEKFSSKTDFDKAVRNITNVPAAPEEGVVRFAPENYKIDGQDAIQYHYSINSVVDMYQIIVPSKMVSFNFVLQALVDYSIEDVKNLVSTIKFNY